MSDFLTLMAEAIAQARPKYTGGGSQPARSTGAVSGTSTQVNLDPSKILGIIQALPGVKRAITGEPEPSEVIKQGNEARNTWANISAISPEEGQKLLLDPQIQLKMDKYAAAKHPDIIDTGERTSLNQTVWGWAPRPSDPEAWKQSIRQGAVPQATQEQRREAFRAPEAHEIPAGTYEGVAPGARESYLTAQERITKAQLPVSEARILSGELGEQARESYLTAKERETKAALSGTETFILSGGMGGDTAKTYYENKRKLEDPQLHPVLAELYGAQKKSAEEQAKHYASESASGPGKATAYMNEANARASLVDAEKRKIDSELESTRNSVIGKLPRETQIFLTEIDKAYNAQATALERQFAAPPGMGILTNYKKGYTKLSQLADYTGKHATAANAVLPGYTGSAANLEYFTLQVEKWMEEMYKPIAGKKVGTFGGGAKEKAEADRMAISLMNKTVMLHSTPGIQGTSTSTAVAKRYVDALNRIREQEEKGKK